MVDESQIKDDDDDYSESKEVSYDEDDVSEQSSKDSERLKPKKRETKSQAKMTVKVV